MRIGRHPGLTDPDLDPRKDFDLLTLLLIALVLDISLEKLKTAKGLAIVLF
jgi:hypothetical protein